MARTQSSWINGILALTSVAALASGPAFADVRVTKSNEPTIKKGDVLKDDAVLDVPANKTIKVLLMPTNVSKVITGPYKGTAKDYQPQLTSKPQVQFPVGATAGSAWRPDR